MKTFYNVEIIKYLVLFFMIVILVLFGKERMIKEVLYSLMDLISGIRILKYREN